MTVQRVLKYPHPVLREVSRPVEWTEGCPFSAEIQTLIADMTDTLYAHGGAIGLAAVQIGQPWRVFLLDMTAKTTQNQLRVLVNPVITHTAKNKWVREGCLSFPDYLASVKRALKVTVSYVDQHGLPQLAEVTELEAVAVQHEMDHLDGVLFIDHIQSLGTGLIPRQSTETAN
jgi:peptide deformylase